MDAVANKTLFIIGINNEDFLPNCKSVKISDFETDLFIKNTLTNKYFRMLTNGCFTIGYVEDLSNDEKDFIDAFKEHHEYGFVGYVEISGVSELNFKGGIQKNDSEIVETNNLDIDKFSGFINEDVKGNIINQLSREKNFEALYKFDVRNFDEVDNNDLYSKFMVEFKGDIKVNLELIANA